MRFVGCRAILGSEIEGGEVGFIDFAEAEGVGDEAFASFDFDKVFAINYAIEIYFGNIILLYHIGTIPCSRIGLPQLIPGIYPLKV